MRIPFAALLLAVALPLRAEEPAFPARTTPAAVTAYDRRDPAELRRSRLMERADTRFTLFAGMTYGGFALVLASPFLIQAEPDMASNLMTVALAAYMVGEPLMGGAATSLNRLASGLPGYRDPGSGWKPYAWSHVLKGAGLGWFMYVLLSNLEVAVVPPFFIPYADISMAEMYPVFALFGAGFASEGYALYQFHSRRNRAMESLATRVSWAPTLKRRTDGGVNPGLAVSLAF